jgi:molybdopterin converting factor subunit 1
MTAVSVLLFGKIREIVGAGEIELPAGPGETAASLLDALVARHPGLAPWRPSLRVAVNREYAPGERAVSAGDEIAVIPPVSGG